MELSLAQINQSTASWISVLFLAMRRCIPMFLKCLQQKFLEMFCRLLPDADSVSCAKRVLPHSRLPSFSGSASLCVPMRAIGQLRWLIPPCASVRTSPVHDKWPFTAARSPNARGDRRRALPGCGPGLHVHLGDSLPTAPGKASVMFQRTSFVFQFLEPNSFLVFQFVTFPTLQILSVRTSSSSSSVGHCYPSSPRVSTSSGSAS